MSLFDIHTDQYKAPFTSFLTEFVVNAISTVGFFNRRMDVMRRRDEYESLIRQALATLIEKPTRDQFIQALHCIDEFKGRDITVNTFSRAVLESSGDKVYYTSYLITICATDRDLFLSDPMDIDVSLATIFPWVF